jgi:CHAT domain-containing protein
MRQHWLRRCWKMRSQHGTLWFECAHGQALLVLCALLVALTSMSVRGVAQDATAIEMSRLEARAKAGERTPELGNAYHNLAIQLRNTGQDGRAELPARRALAIWENAYGPNSGAVAHACNTLAMVLDQLRKDAEAEQCARRAVTIWEKEYGLDSGEAANALNTLVGIMRTRGRWDDAEEPARRVLRIWTKVQGPDSDAVANASNTLSDVLQRKGKFDEAEKLAREALRIWEKLHGADSGAADNARNTLAGALDGLGRKDDALREQQRVLESWSKKFGPNSGTVGLGANNLAWKQLGAGHVDEAEKLFQRTLDIWSDVDTRPAKPSTGIPLSGLARTAMRKLDWQRAHDWVKQAVDIAIERTRMASTETDKIRASKAPSEITQAAGNLQLLIKAAHQLVAAGPSHSAALLHETFMYAQWRLGSQAADALAAMASRVSLEPSLATLVRQRQDLENRWQAIDHALEVDRNKPADQREKMTEQKLLDEAKAAEAKLGELDKRLNKDFAKYVEIARIEPITVEETQALLHPDEALILILPTDVEPPVPEETFIWVVTKSDARWVRSDLGAPTLQREISALRCGLDYYGTSAAEGSRCSELLKTDRNEIDRQQGRLLPFDPQRAHALYTALFGQVEDIINGKRLLLVTSGALTQLPFQVLITNKPKARTGSADFRDLSWLIRTNALSVLPSVSSLRALRQLARDSHVSRTLIGFGNPLLNGPDASYEKWASEARTKQSCPSLPAQRVAGLGLERRGVLALKLRGGLVDVANVRSQVPLPETADELCAVARDLGVGGQDVHLGERATEAEVKRLSAAGELAKYRMVHFATHGALAGQIADGSEPGLLLTPPRSPTELDDGYLSASEIATLKFDADWVILSACNTAAGGTEGAEALSGLARAFLYAGARALLVSHWSVYSDTTVRLITGAVSRMASDKSIGRAEALRQSMLAMIDNGEPLEAHPAYWAPFVVVGEGSER